MKTPVSTTPDILAKFKEVIGGNNRPVQARHGRKVSVTTGASKVH
jgi:carbonic anhydrase